MTASVPDSYWQDMYSFLTHRLKDAEVVLGPEGLKPLLDRPEFEKTIFQNYLTTTYLEVKDFDWVIVHKGMLQNIDPVFLDHLESSLSAVFVNSVFVIFSKHYPWLRLRTYFSSHLGQYYQIRRELKSSNQGSSNQLAAIDKQEEVLNQKFLHSADALLCSYPKCGRTWLRFMLACYFQIVSQTTERMTLGKMAELVPAIASRDKALRKAPLLEKQIHRHDESIKIPFVVATHYNYSSRRNQVIFSSKDIIFLVRNVYDVLVSQYFEQVHGKGYDTTDDVWDYIHKRGLVEAYVTYLNGWAQNLFVKHRSKRYIVLTYENLKRDTEGELIRVLQFLNVEVIPAYVSQSIEMASFENMQKIQLQFREQKGLNDAQTNYAGLRTRRGKIGGYRDYLSESSIQSIRDYCKGHLNESAQTLLSQHGIAL